MASIDFNFENAQLIQQPFELTAKKCLKRRFLTKTLWLIAN